MDDFSEGNEFLDELRQTVVRLLPTFLILLLLVGNMLYASSALLPQWLRYQELSTNVEQVQDELEALAEQGDFSELDVLEAQLDSAEDEIAVVAADFLTDDQVADVIEHLYTYADASGVQIFSLRTQETSPEEAAYVVSVLRAQLTGNVPRLMNFVIRLREATLVTIVLKNLEIQEQDDTAMLTVEIQLYLSPFAEGTALNNLPDYVVPTPFDPPQPTPIVTETPTPQNAEEVLDEPEATPENTRDCSSLPESPYILGDVVVVDFSTDSALNILSLPRTGEYEIEVRALAYDGYVLRLLAGPICGQWEGQTVRYWRVHVDGIEGWIGEGVGEDLWLCPADDPNCVSDPQP